jgi:peroxiredoxin
LLGLFLVARDIRTKVLAVWPEVQQIIGVSRRTVERVEKHAEKIGATSVEIIDSGKQQVAKIDDLLDDATTRAKVQMERAEMVLDDAMTRVQETVAIVQRNVLRPVREVQGVWSGICTALQYLGRRTRSTVDHATSDEEMFI